MSDPFPVAGRPVGVPAFTVAIFCMEALVCRIRESDVIKVVVFVFFLRMLLCCLCYVYRVVLLCGVWQGLT